DQRAAGRLAVVDPAGGGHLEIVHLFEVHVVARLARLHELARSHLRRPGAEDGAAHQGGQKPGTAAETPAKNRARTRHFSHGAWGQLSPVALSSKPLPSATRYATAPRPSAPTAAWPCPALAPSVEIVKGEPCGRPVSSRVSART